MEKLFKIENLSFAYNSEFILDDISFDVNQGDFIGIIGKNGSGKTTLLKLLLGQLKPTKGKVERKKNLRLGYVEQITMSSDNTFPANVLEILLLGLINKLPRFGFAKTKHKKAALLALKQVGLEGFEKKQLSTLSGGQQQKVLIAKTLLENPEILILDEPTTGIDKESQHEFFQLLKHLNEKHNKTIIIVTHDIEKVIATNRILKIEDKQIKERKNASVWVYENCLFGGNYAWRNYSFNWHKSCF